MPKTAIELLIPDFQGIPEALRTVLQAGPDILGHNLETVPASTISGPAPTTAVPWSCSVLPGDRPGDPDQIGGHARLGESEEELLAVLQDLRAAGCAYVSLGQYLAPSLRHQPVVEFVPPERFDRLREAALELGFAHVESGPYVRSSYHADRYR